MTSKYKQCLITRADLKISVGKLAVQVAHAAVEAAEEARKKKREWYDAWLDEGQKKVVLVVKCLDDLLNLEEGARALGLPTALIRDRGLTEVPPETVTALGIGPAPNELVDRLTSKLSLLK